MVIRLAIRLEESCLCGPPRSGEGPRKLPRDVVLLLTPDDGVWNQAALALDELRSANGSATKKLTAAAELFHVTAAVGTRRKAHR
jgi:hypothetical protein